MPPSSEEPRYRTLEEYRDERPEWQEYMLQLFVLEDRFRLDRKNRQQMIRLFMASSDSIFDEPCVILFKAKDLAIAAFNNGGRIDMEILALEEADLYDEERDPDPLPIEIRHKLEEWSANPQLVVDHVNQLVAQLPGNK